MTVPTPYESMLKKHLAARAAVSGPLPESLKKQAENLKKHPDYKDGDL